MSPISIKEIQKQYYSNWEEEGNGFLFCFFFFFCLGKGSLMKNFLKLLVDHKVNLKIYQRIHIELPSIGFPRWFSDKRTLLPMQESQEMGLQPLSWEDHLEWKMAIHSSILAWKIPWTEEPGGLQSTGSQRVRHSWAQTYILSYYHEVGPTILWGRFYRDLKFPSFRWENRNQSI